MNNQDEEFSPDDIAEYLFTKNPDQPCSNQLVTHVLTESEKEDDVDITDLFQMLCNILLKGLDILSNGLDKFDTNNITPEVILNTNPWFASIGIKISVNTFNKDDKELYSNYYCRVIIKDDMYRCYFDVSKIKSNYHFLLNGHYDNSSLEELVDLRLLFIKDNYTVYVINFDYY